jgi:hypothetical protein
MVWLRRGILSAATSRYSPSGLRGAQLWSRRFQVRPRTRGFRLGADALDGEAFDTLQVTTGMGDHGEHVTGEALKRTVAAQSVPVGVAIPAGVQQ